MQIILFIISLFIGYLISYFKEKGKNKALLEDNNKLTTEIENIKQKFTLDIAKRTYQYESKQKLYFQFMNKLDNYNSLQFDLIYDELSQIMMLFFQTKTKEEKDNFTKNYNHKCIEIDTKIKRQSSELFSQLNELRLTANKDTIILLEQLQVEIDKFSIGFLRMTKFIEASGFQYMEKSPKIKEDDTKMNINISSIKNKLIILLKEDLNKI